MASVNAINTKTDLTVQIFDRFYGYEQTVPVAAYDAVLSYFRSVFTTTLAAENFTTALFRVAEESDTSALTLLQSMEGQNSVQLTISMAYYLNSIRSPATLLGVLTPTTPNFYTARNVRQ